MLRFGEDPQMVFSKNVFIVIFQTKTFTKA